LLVICQC